MPSPPHLPCPPPQVHDQKLRALFEQLGASKGSSVKDFQKMAKDKLGVEFSDDQTGFQLTVRAPDLSQIERESTRASRAANALRSSLGRAQDLWARRRQGEMANQVGAS